MPTIPIRLVPPLAPPPVMGSLESRWAPTATRGSSHTMICLASGTAFLALPKGPRCISRHLCPAFHIFSRMWITLLTSAPIAWMGMTADIVRTWSILLSRLAPTSILVTSTLKQRVRVWTRPGTNTSRLKSLSAPVSCALSPAIMGLHVIMFAGEARPSAVGAPTALAATVPLGTGNAPATRPAAGLGWAVTRMTIATLI
mmetsp:Transcript_24362/g.44031  ORF Transcript_24362/g.44031 Transcript_24362/m.44031 type:complete len:200 (+) Transcript_24362:972-1571(+)